MLVALRNPKVAVFFLAFLPQFVEPGTDPVLAQLLLHGLLFIAVAGFVEPPRVFAADRLARGLRAAPRLGLWFGRALGTLLPGLGLKLALSRQ